MEFKKGDIYGTHRVLEPKGVLPQPAEKIDNTMEIYDNEILIKAIGFSRNSNNRWEMDLTDFFKEPCKHSHKE